MCLYLMLLTISHEVREPFVLQHRSDLSLLKIRKRKQHCSSVDSVTDCSSSLPFLWMFPVLSEVSFFYSFHTTIVSNLSLRHTQLLIRTHVHTHLHVFTWWQINITTLQGGCTTQAHARRHTQLVWTNPRGGVVASATAWCLLAGQHFAIPVLYCSNVVILLNQLYMPPEGKQFTNTLLLWSNEMTFEWTHCMFIFFILLYVFLRISPRPFPVFGDEACVVCVTK